MKRHFNWLIERVANRAFDVDQYADVLERLALRKGNPVIARRLFRHKVTADIRQHPLLFIHIPKNGGTSIKRTLYASDPGHATVRLYDLLASDVLRRATSFAVLREPVDRFLSGYDFLMQGGGSAVTIQVAAKRRLSHIATIDDFLDYLELIGNDWFKVDTFARPQWWYIADRHGSIRIDKLWLIGEQNLELERFLAGKGFPAPSRINTTMRVERRLSIDQISRLRRLYEPDFTLYSQVREAPGMSGQELEDKLSGAMRSVLQL